MGYPAPSLQVKDRALDTHGDERKATMGGAASARAKQLHARRSVTGGKKYETGVDKVFESLYKVSDIWCHTFLGNLPS